jgi:hypothetical protein
VRGGCEVRCVGLGRQRPNKRERGFGIRHMIVSLLLTPPVPITLSISIVFWTALLSLFIAVSISFLKNFTMVCAFPFLVGGGRFHRGLYSRSSPPSSGSLGSPERTATSESSSGSPEPRMYLCSVLPLALVSICPMLPVHGRQGGILISISDSIPPFNHT